ncbi:MAG: C25 family cysteine peptidase, partial [Bacteroidales bacterium]|nr:C25 family cysteine peptidase [Bacteroidales bacterium]
MKRLLFICLIVFQTMLSIAGEITHSYHFSQPVLTRSGAYDVINFSNTMLTNRAGEPLLPYHAISLLLPPGERAVSIEIQRKGEIKLDGVFSIIPAQPSRPISESRPSVFIKNEAVYSSEKAYPNSPIGSLTTQFMNGHSFAFSSFTPVEYFPLTGEISFFSEVSVTITTEPDPATKQSMLRSDEKIQSRVMRLAQNSEMLSRYNGKTKSADDYELLIITPMTFANNFSNLIQMYKSRGVRSNVVTTEFILANMPGIDLQERMRNYIIQEYQNHGIETVLLGGDVELVPHRGFYCYVQSGTGYSDTGIPADLYYSGLDGTWNDNGNNRWGEPGEDDLLPDIAVGRMPFNTAAELANMINKSINYQNQPVLGEFTKPLLVGEHLYSAPETWGSDYLELLIGQRSDNGYTTIGIPESYTFQRLYEEDFNWSKNDLMNAINQGKQFVHHVGHASQTYVAKLTNSDITNANFSQVNGITRNYSLLQTHGCDCGAFDYSDCI